MTFRFVRNLFAIGSVAVLAVLGTVGGSAPAGAGSGAVWNPTSVPNCGPTIRKNAVASWRCTFADDFNGTSLDRAKWVPVTTAGSGLAPGPGCYVDSPGNIAVYGGALHLTARQQAPFTCHGPLGDFATPYSAGQVATYGHFSQTYGRFAARAAFPATTVAGLQATLWLWPQYPTVSGTTGEIDFAEWYSSFADRVIPYVHYNFAPWDVNALTGTNVVTNNYCVIGDTSAFHEYVLEWTASSIVIKIDGQACLTDNYQPWGANPFAQPYFVTLTQALGIGGNAFVGGTTPLPATTTVDWVRVWK